MARQKTETKAKTLTKPREVVVREQIRELSEQTEGSYIVLADLLSEVYHNRYYPDWGYEDFTAYANAETHTGYRKAMMLVKVADRLRDLGADMDKAAKLGWTKIRELLRLKDLTRDNIDIRLDEAEHRSVRDIADRVRISKETDISGGNLPVIHKLEVVLGEDTWASVGEALEMGKRLLNTDSNAVALSHICMDWMQSQDESPQLMPLDVLVAYAKRTYGVDLVEGRRADDEVVLAPEPGQKPEKKAKAESKAKAEPKAKKAPKPPTIEQIKAMKKADLEKAVKKYDLTLPEDCNTVPKMKAYLIETFSGPVDENHTAAPEPAAEPTPEPATAEAEGGDDVWDLDKELGI